jgi:hypothetical protein
MIVAVIWIVAPCSQVEVCRRYRGFALAVEAASTSETSVSFYQTTRRNTQKAAIFILGALRTCNSLKKVNV